jgi:hypothetical protein
MWEVGCWMLDVGFAMWDVLEEYYILQRMLNCAEQLTNND